MHGLGHEPVCKGVIAGLQGGTMSYFEALKVLMRALDTSAESVERAQGIGEKIGPDGTRVNAEPLILGVIGLYEAEGLVAGAIGDAEWDKNKKEEIAAQFFKEKGHVLIQRCFQALSDLGLSRLAVKPLTESNPDIICHVSNAVVALTDAIALARGAHTLATGNVVAEDSQPIKETKRRVRRCVNASYSAVNTIPVPVLQASIDQLRKGGSGEKIREMMYCLLKEVSALSDLIRDDEGEVSRKSVSGAFFVAEDLLQQCTAKSPAFDDHPEAALCTSVVRAAMKCAYDEHRRNAEGTHQRDSDVGDGHCLSMMLLEATAATCEVCAAFSAVPAATSDVGRGKILAGDLNGKLGAALSVLHGRHLSGIRSLGDANVFSYITGILADAQLLLEDIDVHSLPNPELHGELLNNVRKTLCEAAAICIKQQCAGNPEYSVPAECDCNNPNEWGFPSTDIEDLVASLLGDLMECRIM
ncbi:hypothetical protein [Anaplasma phagocytophilum]|uniref:hypothetical protein n=1 Tax=Anaplasma phagocytophilum TaxID=948 RepID=UPI0020103496|nr:hypothetical protein [Anaplasma phagocytophilum]